MNYKKDFDIFHRYIEKYYRQKDRSRQKHDDNHNVVTVSAVVSTEFIHCQPDLKGTLHQHFYVYIKELLEGDKNLIDLTTVFVAVHYGDEESIAEPIPGLVPGRPITIRGKFVPASEAYKSEDNPGYPVLHFTHHPVGYILYEGKRYE